MNHWPFITAAYVVAIGGIVALTIAAYVAMRRAERP
jgi:hypothetical protein